MIKSTLTTTTLVLALASCSVNQKVEANHKLFISDKKVESPIPEDEINELLKKHKINGVSIAFVKDRYDYRAKGYGFTSSSKETKVNENTAFQASKISQTVAILALLNLVENDKISLDTDLRDFLIEFEIHNNYPNTYISLRNLLKHRGGINISNFEAYERGEPLPNSIQLSKGVAPAKNEALQVIYEPLKTLQFSDGGFHIVQLIIEKLMREPYEIFATSYVLNPLKMFSSSFINPLDSLNTSQGYYSKNKAIKHGWNLYPQSAAEGLWTTSLDLAKLLDGLLWVIDGKMYFISPENGQEIIKNQLGVNYNYETQTINYTGQNEGYTVQFKGSLISKTGIVILANSGNAGALINDIYELLNKDD